MTTTVDLTRLNDVVLGRFAAELRAAGPEQFEHLARRAEARFDTDLGARMRDLVEEARARRTFTLALMPLPPAGDQPQAGAPIPVVGLPTIFAALSARLGWEDEADRIERWEREGKVGCWTDPEYDVPDPRVRPDSGEGGS